jgi:TolA-binding protein
MPKPLEPANSMKPPVVAPPIDATHVATVEQLRFEKQNLELEKAKLQGQLKDMGTDLADARRLAAEAQGERDRLQSKLKQMTIDLDIAKKASEGTETGRLLQMKEDRIKALEWSNLELQERLKGTGAEGGSLVPPNEFSSSRRRGADEEEFIRIGKEVMSLEAKLKKSEDEIKNLQQEVKRLQQVNETLQSEKNYLEMEAKERAHSPSRADAVIGASTIKTPTGAARAGAFPPSVAGQLVLTPAPREAKGLAIPPRTEVLNEYTLKSPNRRLAAERYGVPSGSAPGSRDKTSWFHDEVYHRSRDHNLMLRFKYAAVNKRAELYNDGCLRAGVECEILADQATTAFYLSVKVTYINISGRKLDKITIDYSANDSTTHRH